MSDLLFPLLMIPLALGLVAVFIYSWIADRRRREALLAFAINSGFSILAEDDESTVAAIENFDLGTRGRGRNCAWAALRESAEGQVRIADYRYTSGSGKNQTTYSTSIVLCQLQGLSLPKLRCTPMSFFHKIGSIFGYQDISIDDDPNFSKNLLLRGEDEDAIRALFTAELRSWLLEHPGWSFEGSADQILIYREHERVRVEKVASFLQDALELCEQIAAASGWQPVQSPPDTSPEALPDRDSQG